MFHIAYCSKPVWLMRSETVSWIAYWILSFN